MARKTVSDPDCELEFFAKDGLGDSHEELAKIAEEYVYTGGVPDAARADLLTTLIDTVERATRGPRRYRDNTVEWKRFDDRAVVFKTHTNPFLIYAITEEFRDGQGRGQVTVLHAGYIPGTQYPTMQDFEAIWQNVILPRLNAGTA